MVRLNTVLRNPWTALDSGYTASKLWPVVCDWRSESAGGFNNKPRPLYINASGTLCSVCSTLVLLFEYKLQVLSLEKIKFCSTHFNVLSALNSVFPILISTPVRRLKWVCWRRKCQKQGLKEQACYRLQIRCLSVSHSRVQVRAENEAKCPQEVYHEK